MSEKPDLAALFGAGDVETFLGLPAPIWTGSTRRRR